MESLLKQRNTLLNKIDQYSEFVRGSINSVCATCNRARCICQQKLPRRAYRLTYKNSQQKTRIVYISRSQLPKIKKMIANYTQLRRLIEQLFETNIKIFKKEAHR
jgi:hypothetical protein